MALHGLVRRPLNECVERDQRSRMAMSATLIFQKKQYPWTTLGLQRYWKNRRNKKSSFSAYIFHQIHELYSFAPHWNQFFFKRIAACLVLWMIAAHTYRLNELLSRGTYSPLFHIPNIIASFYIFFFRMKRVACFFSS